MKVIKGKVTLTVGSGDNQKDHVGSVQYNELENADDVLSFLQDEAKTAELLSAANYGFNLKARGVVRQSLQATVAGPDKAIEAMVKAVIKMRAAFGQPISEEDARAEVLKMQPQKEQKEQEEQAA